MNKSEYEKFLIQWMENLDLEYYLLLLSKIDPPFPIVKKRTDNGIQNSNNAPIRRKRKRP